MEGIKRTSFQCVSNIIRFNWHFYTVAGIIVLFLIIAGVLSPPGTRILISLLMLMVFLSILFSLALSHYVYDRSGFYTLNWKNELIISGENKIITINAGFDETSHLLREKFPSANLTVFDFYDPAKHTEVSIERARNVYAIYPGTKTISTSDIPLPANSVDYIFLILSAHEIRSSAERIYFFHQLMTALRPTGRIVVTEHLRDLPNFIAFNVGFFHFFSRKEWCSTFTSAGLSIIKENKITPFISSFILKKYGTAS